MEICISQLSHGDFRAGSQLQPAVGLPSPGLAQLSSAGLISAASGPQLSVEGFSKQTRKFLHLWLSGVGNETTAQRQQECSSGRQNRQKSIREA